MPLTLAQFHKQLAGGELKPVYLLAGEEHLLLLEAADELRARARALGYVEREVIDAEANGDWNDLTMAMVSMSLFSSRKVIDLRLPGGKPGKEGSAAIMDYCRNPPPDTVLLITCTQWSKQHETAWVAAVERAGVFVPVWPLKPDELPEWIGQRMARRGLRPDRDAIAALAERVEGNLLAAAQEIDKLHLLHGDKPLDAATLEDLVADSARFDVFRLSDAALGGDAARALRVLAGLRAEGEQVPGLLPIVAMEVLKIATLARAARGGNLAAAMREARVWDSKQALYRRALERHEEARWESFAAEIGRIDLMSKGRLAGDAWLALERLLSAIASSKARALLA